MSNSHPGYISVDLTLCGRCPEAILVMLVLTWPCVTCGRCPTSWCWFPTSPSWCCWFAASAWAAAVTASASTPRPGGSYCDSLACGGTLLPRSSSRCPCAGAVSPPWPATTSSTTTSTGRSDHPCPATGSTTTFTGRSDHPCLATASSTAIFTGRSHRPGHSYRKFHKQHLQVGLTTLAIATENSTTASTGGSDHPGHSYRKFHNSIYRWVWPPWP